MKVSFFCFTQQFDNWVIMFHLVTFKVKSFFDGHSVMMSSKQMFSLVLVKIETDF